MAIPQLTPEERKAALEKAKAARIKRAEIRDDLKSGKLDQMLNSRDVIILSDLLRASFNSNNRSIREYLDTLKNGQALLDQLNSGDLDWDTFNQPTSLMEKDTKANYDTLSTFAWHLATIYNSTLSGKERPYQLIHQQADQQSY